MHITNMMNVLHTIDIRKFYEWQAPLSMSIEVQISDRLVSASSQNSHE